MMEWPLEEASFPRVAEGWYEKDRTVRGPDINTKPQAPAEKKHSHTWIPFLAQMES